MIDPVGHLNILVRSGLRHGVGGCRFEYCVFDKRITEYLPRRGDIERLTFPRLSRLRKLGAYRHQGSFITVNSLRELEEAEDQLKENRRG